MQIDAALKAAGWSVQDWGAEDLGASQGVAVREYPMARGHGTVDYLLFVDRKAVGVLEAKKEEMTLSGVEGQAKRYSDGLPAKLPAPIRPLPFVYTSTGLKTELVNRLDPFPRSREVFAPHRPETLAEWLRSHPSPTRRRAGRLQGPLAEGLLRRAHGGAAVSHVYSDLEARVPSS